MSRKPNIREQRKNDKGGKECFADCRKEQVKVCCDWMPDKDQMIAMKATCWRGSVAETEGRQVMDSLNRAFSSSLD